MDIKINEVENFKDSYKLSVELTPYEKIYQELLYLFVDDKDKKISQALIEMGWTPPVSDKINLKTIERYAMDSHGGWGEDSYMAKCCDGEYVLYEDVLKLLTIKEKGE